jgi:hypothetical protein
MEELKFQVLQNPNGILFDPVSVCASLISYTLPKQYSDSDLLYLNELWLSWQHHSRFSHTNASLAVALMNESHQRAHEFLAGADWIIITLGSSFSYHLKDLESGLADFAGAVANCHRAPAQWFNKKLLQTQEVIGLLENCYHRLLAFNPKLNFLFTVSPVRHLRDGVIENNRSKARLIESVHHMVHKYERSHYFPAYELVIDVLRDYRFYDIDLTHPNYMATEFVLEKFASTCIGENEQQLMQEIRKIIIARKHMAFQPDTNAHRQFLQSHFEKANALQEKFPFLDLKEEMDYFSR